MQRLILDRLEQVMNQDHDGTQRQAASEPYLNQTLENLDEDRMNEFRNVCHDAALSDDEKLFSPG
ncbi:hypothetical protein DQK91_22195 [Oceanidesulfovibrio marinus]|uniref:Uncharacterized protein n=2 Tax=Oceanidesulfovibrio marinus TaxID=370038 RepID=A0A6P1ZBP7_9BACT|nr:hypothetical protein DQK91_22195 [Oceanidesulfovibrio marinus]